jgi:LysM repeat protein
MNKWRSLFCFLTSWIVIITSFTNTEAKEDTAHMTLRKTAAPGKNTQQYVVQKGDSIERIMQKFIEGSAHRYTIIKQLNPELKNLHRIYPGQTIILPNVEAEAKEVAKEQVPSKQTNDGKLIAYRVKKGDSITRILNQQLHVYGTDIPKTLRLIKNINPGLSDLNRIQIGQTIMLPANGFMTSSAEILSSNKPDEQKIVKKPLLPPEKEMNFLKQLISRNHGSMISRGNYFIPLPLGRTIIDCSITPIVEFDDGSTVLLDFSDSMPKFLKKSIESNWKNYRVIKVRPSQDQYLIFQETINESSSYVMKKVFKPFLLEKEPQVLLSLDWIITSKKAAETKPYFHGILLGSDKNQQLPGRIKQYTERKGIQLTEIQNGEILINTPPFKATPALELPSISSDNNKDFIFNLLVRLGYSPLKDQELKLYDNSGNGVHLSLKPDIMLKKDQREILISSKKLPQQLIEALSQQKKEVYVIDARVSKRTALSKVLSALRITSSVGRYSFYIAEKGRKAKITITLPAVKIDRKGTPVYLIDYDLESNLYTLLHENWNAEIVRY